MFILVFVIQEFGSQFERRAVEILVDSALTQHCSHPGIYCRTKEPAFLRFDHALAFASGAAGHKKTLGGHLRVIHRGNSPGMGMT
jgi:hypothetical protein